MVAKNSAALIHYGMKGKPEPKQHLSANLHYSNRSSLTGTEGGVVQCKRSLEEIVWQLILS